MPGGLNHTLMAKDIVLSEKEVKKTVPFTAALKTTKFLGISLMKSIRLVHQKPEIIKRMT